MSDFRKYLDKQLKDPEFKAEWDALQPELAIMQAMIDARKSTRPYPETAFRKNRNRSGRHQQARKRERQSISSDTPTPCRWYGYESEDRISTSLTQLKNNKKQAPLRLVMSMSGVYYFQGISANQ